MSETLTQNEILQHIKEPSMWQVFILNDNDTPMLFVERILTEVFHMSKEIGHKTMMCAHSTGKASCGVYTYEIAETKVSQVKVRAAKAKYPLKAIMEELT